MTARPRHRSVADVMTVRVHVASPDTPFKQLVHLIEDNRVSAVPIVDEVGIPVGIVSEHDLLLKERRQELEAGRQLLHPMRMRRQRTKAGGLAAADLMTTPVITVASDTTLPRAAHRMQQSNVRRLVVVDEHGQIAGIVSRSDLLQVFLRTDAELKEEVTSSIIPLLLLDEPPGVEVKVRSNVVTLSGEVDRKTDAAILARLTRELDGVVEVVDRLTYRWDDTARRPTAAGSASP
ncbi:MAG TPA: CBS domain-containing protein [Candidatus Dormibacteraeota bacterium]|jgi:CBS domain-containing protein